MLLSPSRSADIWNIIKDNNTNFSGASVEEMIQWSSLRTISDFWKHNCMTTIIKLTYCSTATERVTVWINEWIFKGIVDSRIKIQAFCSLLQYVVLSTVEHKRRYLKCFQPYNESQNWLFTNFRNIFCVPQKQGFGWTIPLTALLEFMLSCILDKPALICDLKP